MSTRSAVVIDALNVKCYYRYFLQNTNQP